MRMRNLIRILAMTMAVCLGALAPADAQDDAGRLHKEYQVKAAFLYNFVKFVQWPGAQALDHTHAANICVMGTDPFGSILDIFKQASSSQLALNVKRGITDADIPTCHILFIARSEEDRVGQILAIARNNPVLTVSEMKGFADKGGIVEMVKTEENIGLFSKDKINLRINVKVATAEGLHIDAQLLEIAAEVMR